jgi:hypothetical protein
MPRSSLLDPARPRATPRTTEQEAPSLAEILQLTIASRTEFDTGKRNAITRALYNATGHSPDKAGSELVVPSMIARSMIPDTITRTGVGYVASGPGGYGDTLKVDYAPFVADRARPTRGPCDLMNWWPVKTRQYEFPAVQESSRSTGQRWGGIQATWGLNETSLPAATDGKVSLATFDNQRLLIYTQVSRDVWQDSESLARWLSYIAMSEIRFSIELAVINGITNGPTGIVNEPCTVTVPKGSLTSGTIGATAIDAQWSALSAGSKERAVWHANDDTIQAIDQLAVSGQFPEGLYFPRGYMGNQYAQIKGADLIPNEACPIIGTPGDLIAVDWSDYVFTYIRPRPETSPLSFSIEIPNDQFYRGIRGLPEGVVEQRMSDQAFFSTDVIAIVWKLRGCGRFLWNSQATNINGAAVGPAAVIAKR